MPITLESRKYNHIYSVNTTRAGLIVFSLYSSTLSSILTSITIGWCKTNEHMVPIYVCRP